MNSITGPAHDNLSLLSFLFFPYRFIVYLVRNFYAPVVTYMSLAITLEAIVLGSAGDPLCDDRCRLIVPNPSVKPGEQQAPFHFALYLCF